MDEKGGVCNGELLRRLWCGQKNKMVLRASPRSMGRGGEEFEKESGGKGEGRKIEGYMKRVSSYI